jgi:hypothetical protein
MEALAKKPCELCLIEFEPDRAAQRICPDCMGIKPYPLSAVPDPPTESFLATCNTCGKEYTPYLVGKGLVRVKCMKCRIAGMHAGRKKRFKEMKALFMEKQQEAVEVPVKTYPPEFLYKISEDLKHMDDNEILDHQLIIDFCRHPELLTAIREVADKNFRSEQQQILWMIKVNCLDNAQ